MLSLTVDDYVKSSSVVPDLMKIDIEGGEALAVFGMLDTLNRKRSILILEFHPLQISNYNIKPEQIIKTILDIGYKAWAVCEYRAEIHKDGGPKLLPLKINEISSERPTMLFFEPK